MLAVRVPPRDADAGWRLWWGLSSVFRAWRPLVGPWGTGGLQHGDIHAVGLLGPPCARWLVLGAVVHRWLLSLRPPWSVFASGGARAARVLSPGAGRRPGPLWGAFLLLSCKIYVYYFYVIENLLLTL